MTLPTNIDLATRELSTSELDAISAGLVLTHGPNPRRGDDHGGGCHHGGYHHPYQPPRFYPGGVPNAAGLQIHH
jgi:hypothetical protein